LRVPTHEKVMGGSEGIAIKLRVEWHLRQSSGGF